MVKVLAQGGLEPRPALDGFDRSAGGVRARGIDAAILALAVPLGRDDDFARGLKDAYGVERPEAGRAVRTKDGAWIAALAADQLWWLDAEADLAHALPRTPAALADVAYATEQSDAWAALRLEGEAVREVLARLCMLDLHPDAFTVGAVTRTLMEHMGIVILREEDEGAAGRFLLLAPRSFAGSFAHAIETSLNNAAPRQ